MLHYVMTKFKHDLMSEPAVSENITYVMMS